MIKIARSLTASAAAAALALTALSAPAFAGKPKWAEKSDSTIVEFAVGASGTPFDFDANGEDFDILVAALIATGVVGIFDGSDYTVFAPNDQAFYDLTATDNDADAFNAVVELLGVEGVAAVLAYHVTEGVRNSRSVVGAKRITMLDDNTIAYDRGLGLIVAYRVPSTTDSGDLGTHHGAVEQIHRQKGGAVVVAGYFEVSIHKHVGIAEGAARNKVHRQEGIVGDDVYFSKFPAEFDAVESADALIEPHDISEMQVAMAFTEETGLDTLAHERLVHFDTAIQPRTQPLEEPGRYLGLQRVEIVPDEFFRCCLQQRRGLYTLRDLVPKRDFLGECEHVVVAQTAALYLAIEARQLVELAHAHGVFHGSPFAIYPEDPANLHDRHDLEVQLGRPAAVKAQLFLAVVAPLFECPEIEKIELYGFLDLVGKLAGQHHPRDVCFEKLDAADSVWISSRGQQVLDKHGLRTAADILPHWRQMPPRRPCKKKGPVRGPSSFLAGGEGFEPPLAESESAVLPLDDPPNRIARPPGRLAFRVLRGPACFPQTDLFAFDFASVAGYESGFTQTRSQ